MSEATCKHCGKEIHRCFYPETWEHENGLVFCTDAANTPAEPSWAPVETQEFVFFRCLSCGFNGSITTEEIAKHRAQCTHGPTVPISQAEWEARGEPNMQHGDSFDTPFGKFVADARCPEGEIRLGSYDGPVLMKNIAQTSESTIPVDAGKREHEMERALRSIIKILSPGNRGVDGFIRDIDAARDVARAALRGE